MLINGVNEPRLLADFAGGFTTSASVIDRRCRLTAIGYQHWPLVNKTVAEELV